MPMPLKESCFARFWRRHRERLRRRRASAPRTTAFLLEPLEPRILLSATPLVVEADPLQAADLLLTVETVNGIPTVQVIDQQAPAGADVVASQAVVDTSQVDITGTAFDDRLTIGESAASLLPWTLPEARVTTSCCLPTMGPAHRP